MELVLDVSGRSGCFLGRSVLLCLGQGAGKDRFQTVL